MIVAPDYDPFRGAGLRTADLQLVNLSEANLHLAELSGAKCNANTQWPEDFDPEAKWAKEMILALVRPQFACRLTRLPLFSTMQSASGVAPSGPGNRGVETPKVP